jgi:hypothetical protein
VASWDDVHRIALALPEATVQDRRGAQDWRVRDKGFIWERPLKPTDLEALGDTAPTGPILAARVPHLEAKEALVAEDPDVYFTIPHFHGYPAILVRLDEIAVDELTDLVIEAWLCRAPKRLAAEYLKSAN